MRTQKQIAARMSAAAEVAFKKQLVAAREAAGLSQRRLADLMGVDNSTISRMERLDSDPRLSDLRQYLTQCKAALSLNVISAAHVESKWVDTYISASPKFAAAAPAATPVKATKNMDWAPIGALKPLADAA
ncbi:helix-turn-helix DNA binding protein [Gordonia phage Suerte]|uniref:Helix-turn-helix DNA binding protein n=1 Tax=Gordonia phage Suerte TaxID=2652883 RepID=A0A5P8DF58_9CAUD|nr:transcriptional regulator [Gordonia phage Suerte]QFP97009.1 helix-turn-helix DNA binding protein [Gordonia phage Suerte]